MLLDRKGFGESLEDLEDGWEAWLHRLPFDAPVAATLGTLYERRLAKLDRKKNAAAYERLERRLLLARGRAARYSESAFTR